MVFYSSRQFYRLFLTEGGIPLFKRYTRRYRTQRASLSTKGHRNRKSNGGERASATNPSKNRGHFQRSFGFRAQNPWDNARETPLFQIMKLHLYKEFRLILIWIFGWISGVPKILRSVWFDHYLIKNARKRFYEARTHSVLRECCDYRMLCPALLLLLEGACSSPFLSCRRRCEALWSEWRRPRMGFRWHVTCSISRNAVWIGFLGMFLMLMGAQFCRGWNVSVSV